MGPDIQGTSLFGEFGKAESIVSKTRLCPNLSSHLESHSRCFLAKFGENKETESLELVSPPSQLPTGSQRDSSKLTRFVGYVTSS